MRLCTATNGRTIKLVSNDELNFESYLFRYRLVELSSCILFKEVLTK
jgi:hypothetical protein